MSSNKLRILDCLYGDVEFADPLSSLIRLPVIQRLRHVRLSNIDSVSMPGISGTSRYEHAVGVGYLALRTRAGSMLNDRCRRLCFVAAALLHDSAITPYGHLVEEAMQYLGRSVDHEVRWSELLSDSEAETGGLDLQVYCGRESGLRKWAFKAFGEDSEDCLKSIFDTIKGIGPLGKWIRSSIDLDNLDNVVRAAYHMGIEVTKDLPLRIVQGMMLVDGHDTVTFSSDVVEQVKKWLDLRREVYNRFMLSEPDFAGKIMLVASTIAALEAEVVSPRDWRLSDTAYIETLCSSNIESVKEPAKRWLLGDLWPMTKLIWFHGERPDYKHIFQFGTRLTEELSRKCIAYGIQDKRTREIALELSNGETLVLGARQKAWVLAVGSPKREPFRYRDNDVITRIASESFGWRVLDTFAKRGALRLFPDPAGD